MLSYKGVSRKISRGSNKKRLKNSKKDQKIVSLFQEETTEKRPKDRKKTEK